MATAAERKRRSRAHRAGDHSLCLPERCPAARAAAEAPAEPPELDLEMLDDPEGLDFGPRGSRLWQQMATGLPAGHRVLLEEACRIADRLDRLDAILAGRQDWLKVEALYLEIEVRVKVSVDAVLAEARQQANALRGIVAELRQAGANKAGASRGSGGPPPGSGKAREGSIAELVDLAAWR